MKIAGRANFTFSPNFKTLLSELSQKGYDRVVIDLSECVLMDSTFLGVLAQFGLQKNAAVAPDENVIKLLNPNPRITELLENLGALHLFKIITGNLPLPGDAQVSTIESTGAPREQITRTCLEAHKTLMAVNPENAARFKDVTQFLAEDLKNLEKH
ncbi:MAG TPA: STAS domain-containing protein [Verrucomicrobiae bacterium]|nr:STAS domain-containing protein [Verrucomicrobiae bacterium]